LKKVLPAFQLFTSLLPLGAADPLHDVVCVVRLACAAREPDRFFESTPWEGTQW